jgi:hypothetical protein
MAHRLALQAEADLDDIAYYVFRETGNLSVVHGRRDLSELSEHCSALPEPYPDLPDCRTSSSIG